MNDINTKETLNNDNILKSESSGRKKSFKEIKKNNPTTGHILDIVFIALFSALIAVCAQISIPTTIPFTLQTLAIFIASALLGLKRGTLSTLIYILLGVVGVPVFANFSGGIGCLVGPTGGYIVGFIFTAIIIGIMTDILGKKIWVLALSMVIGMAICYVFGTAWFCISAKAEIGYAISLCVLPYLLFDAGKIVVATILVNRLDKIVEL